MVSWFVFQTAHTLLPSGPFAAGDIGTNVCPVGSARIENELVCKQANESYGKPYDPDFTNGPSTRHPRGCMLGINLGRVYFNPTPTGAGNNNFAPLCQRGNPVASTTAIPVTVTSTRMHSMYVYRKYHTFLHVRSALSESGHCWQERLHVH
jgi:hypothetical protein